MSIVDEIKVMADVDIFESAKKKDLFVKLKGLSC